MSKREITLTINDEEMTLNVKNNETLLHVLRHRLQLTGTKSGCESGDCGACAVLLDGVPVNSCLLLIADCEGKRVNTIESLTQDAIMHPLQENFIKYDAVQCGYCTPGMIIVAKELLERNKKPTEEEIKEAISGNLCRCTGYQKIIAAIKKTGESLNE